MTTSTSRPATAAATASCCPGRKPGKPNSSRSAPSGSRERATGSGGGGPSPGSATLSSAVVIGPATIPPVPDPIPLPGRVVTEPAQPCNTGRARSNASLRCPASVPASGYSPEKQASQWFSREPRIAS